MTNNQNINQNAEIQLREITDKTVVQICKLSDTLSEQQRKMVAPNAVSIAQAYFSDKAWFRAIYADDTPVGFIMLYDDPEKPEYFLWRLMIAGPYQRHGFGRKAVTLLCEYLKTRPAAKELFASYVPIEDSPEKFYQKLGFEPTGEVKDGEVVMRLLLG